MRRAGARATGQGGQVMIITLVLMTLTIVAGAALSPLSWLYLVLIIVETLQHRRRGLAVACLSWALVVGVLIAQTSHQLPTTLTGVTADPRQESWRRPWWCQAQWLIKVQAEQLHRGLLRS